MLMFLCGLFFNHTLYYPKRSLTFYFTVSTGGPNARTWEKKVYSWMTMNIFYVFTWNQSEMPGHFSFLSNWDRSLQYSLFLIVPWVNASFSCIARLTGDQTGLIEAKWLAQGHKVIKWQIQDSNPGLVITKSMLYTFKPL